MSSHRRPWIHGLVHGSIDYFPERGVGRVGVVGGAHEVPGQGNEVSQHTRGAINRVITKRNQCEPRMTTFVQPRKARLRASLAESARRTRRRRCSTRLRPHRKRFERRLADPHTFPCFSAGLLGLGRGFNCTCTGCIVLQCASCSRTLSSCSQHVLTTAG